MVGANERRDQIEAMLLDTRGWMRKVWLLAGDECLFEKETQQNWPRGSFGSVPTPHKCVKQWLAAFQWRARIINSCNIVLLQLGQEFHPNGGQSEAVTVAERKHDLHIR
jgi:hypothetical protein